MFARSDLIQALDWTEIRRQHEEDGYSISALTRIHKVPSRTTIARRAKAEEWQMSAVDVPPPPNPKPRQPTSDPAPQPEPAPAPEPPKPELPPFDETEIIPMAEIVAEQALFTAAADIQDEKFEPEVMGPERLAQLHTERIKDQLVIASRVTGAGMQVFEIISTLLDADDDPLTVARASIALRKLTNVNPDRDTLAGLLKAAADVVSKGLDIERRALGMDLRRSAPPERGSDQPTNPLSVLADTTRPGARLIKMLDADMAFKLREMAQRTIMAKRQNEIAAQVEAD